MRFPLISIITTVYNDKQNIEKTIRSVINQKYKRIQYIVVDAGSTDGTLKKIIKYKNHIDKIISEPDKGIYFGINKGLKYVKGDIIGFIDSGDTYYSKTFSIVKKYFSNDKILDFIFGPVIKDKLLYKFEPKKMWWSFNFYPSQSGGFFISRKAQNKIGDYNTKYLCSSDYDFFYRMIQIFKMKGMIANKNEVFSRSKRNGYSSTFTFFEHSLEELRIRINNNQNKLIVFFVFIIKIIKHFKKI
jgi:glycosyltransferase involved in cell wall biosynthesis